MSLPAAARLLESGPLMVAQARAAQIPRLLREIGRRREEAFRAVGEGTGAEHDLDAYDPHYTHLFAWDRERRALAGAYRLVATESFAPSQLPHALYTHALFDYGPSSWRGSARPSSSGARSSLRNTNAVRGCWPCSGRASAAPSRSRTCARCSAR